MGSEVSEVDQLLIHSLCEEVIQFEEHMSQLYLETHMVVIAPNLTVLVGAGAKRDFFPAKTNKKPTPKHGYLCDTTVIRDVPRRFRGKTARVLAGKVVICVRCDLLGDGHGNAVGLDCLQKIITLFHRAARD
ncbi:unnamed protein product [Microthlaspi erraticum]|uniref:Nop domain-containing protein n=1 Tax=Microthlaspi erraticum TaxID=1685480 RepID=A0A6D2HK31_9BRAS|nr:unnamed protein product [Microthlaspi erraticum]